MRDLNLLRELTQLWGVAGYEKPVRQYIEKIVAPYADERSCWRHIWMKLDLW